MADLQITGLPALAEAGIQATDVAAVADISATETKKVTIKDLIAAGVALIDDADIPAAKVGTLGTNQVATGAIQDGAVSNVKLANSSISLGGLTLALGSTDATPALNLSDATNYPASSLSGTITNAQLAGSIAGSKLLDTTIAYAKLNLSDGDLPGAKITSASITATQLGTDSVTAAKIAENAVGASEIGSSVITSAHVAANTLTANNLAANCIGSSELADSSVDAGALQSDAVTTIKVLDANITAAKLAANLPGSILATGAIGSTQLAANSVTASELADNAVDSGAIASSAVTDAKVASGISGTKISDGTITPAKLNTSNLDRSLNVASGNLGINNTITAATRSGITYNAQGLITASTALVAGDLPVATTSAVGGVSVGTGLSVSGAGALSLTNSVTGATVSGITFNNQGMITAATALVAGDLPVATTSAKGAVQITSGGGLTVDGSGNLTTSTSGVSAGTYQSVTVNNKGVVTTGAALTAALIPDLAASKITSGSLDAARIGADTIDGTKLSNSSTALFQSIAQQGYPTAQFNGQILFDTVSEDAYIWDGNAWQAITTLTKGSLVFGGNFNANTSKMTACTSAGLAAGLAVGSNLPTPSSTTDGLYVVVDTAGTPSAPAPVVAFSPPDYILGVTNASGSSWNEIDLSQTVAGQVASNITFTPYGQLSSTNVQDALQELETEKLALAGGTITGQVLIGNTGSLVFEGSTIDAYETTITVADPTSSDKTITFPDTTGTVITSGDTNTVTSTMVDASLVNANLASGAAIAFSKLAALTSAQILVGNGSNVPTAVAVTGDISINNAGLTAIAAGVIVDADISGSAAITGSKIATGTTSAVGVLQLTDSATSTSATTAATPAAVKIAKDAADAAATTANAALPKAGGTMTGNLILDNAKELRLSEGDSDGANYTGLKAQAQSGDITLTLPAVAPTAGQVLKADASTPTTLTWAADSATDSTKMPLAGGTFTGDVTFTGDSSNGLWDKSASAFVANLTGNVTGNASGSAATVTGAAQSAITSLGTLTGLTVDGDLTLTGASANVTWDKSTDDLIFNDNAKAIFGTSSDGLELFHNGSHSVIKEAGTGALKVVTNSSFQIRNADEATGEYLINANVDGSVSLYNNGLKKLETYASGIYAYGTVAVQGAEDSDAIIEMFADEGDDAADKWRLRSRTNGYFKLEQYNGSAWETSLEAVGGGETSLFHNSVKTFETDASGVKISGPEGDAAHLYMYADEGDDNADKWAILASAGGTFQIRNYSTGSWVDGLTLDGSNNATFAGDVNLASGNKFVAGSSSELEIYHSTYSRIVADDLKIVDKANGHGMITAASGGAVGLRYANVQKLVTTSTGVTVAGTVQVGSNSAPSLLESSTGGGGSEDIFRVGLNRTNASTSDRQIWSEYTVSSSLAKFAIYARTANDTGTAGLKFSVDAVAGTVSDSKGDLRKIPVNTQGSAYTLVAGDAGKFINASGNITVPPSVFAVGQAITIYNSQASTALSIIRGTGVSVYNAADATDATRTLAGRGIATLLNVGTDTFVISGAGLS